MAKLCRLIGWDETLAFIIQPNFLCQLFMVDKFHRGRVAGICSTNHHCQAGWGTKYIAPYLLLVINIMHIVEYWYTWQLPPTIVNVLWGGSKYAAILCGLLSPCDSQQRTTEHKRWTKIEANTEILSGEQSKTVDMEV